MQTTSQHNQAHGENTTIICMDKPSQTEEKKYTHPISQTFGEEEKKFQNQQ